MAPLGRVEVVWGGGVSVHNNDNNNDDKDYDGSVTWDVVPIQVKQRGLKCCTPTLIKHWVGCIGSSCFESFQRGDAPQ